MWQKKKKKNTFQCKCKKKKKKKARNCVAWTIRRSKKIFEYIRARKRSTIFLLSSSLSSWTGTYNLYCYCVIRIIIKKKKKEERNNIIILIIIIIVLNKTDVTIILKDNNKHNNDQMKIRICIAFSTFSLNLRVLE